MNTAQIMEDVSGEEIAMRMYQISRKHASGYSESRINSSKSLRQTLSKTIINEVKNEFPHNSSEIIQEAAKMLQHD